MLKVMYKFISFVSHCIVMYYVCRRHWDSKHGEEGPLSCDICGKLCASRNALGTHMSRYHRRQDVFQ